eukprot:TRINITY_DN8985_c0_g1_i1.p1 TRINITY_DN8985_c0_g1~~TRINITY_DN8985_c0_g1_i1.p1  ORF type:complete len:231 (+),score=54.88 TRINITY_DN8985_c0_g1_i1:137-829(+)
MLSPESKNRLHYLVTQTIKDICCMINPRLRDAVPPKELQLFLSTTLEDLMLLYGVNTLTQQNMQRRLLFNFINTQGRLNPEDRQPFMNEIMEIFPMNIPEAGEKRKLNQIVQVKDFVAFIQNIDEIALAAPQQNLEEITAISKEERQDRRITNLENIINQKLIRRIQELETMIANLPDPITIVQTPDFIHNPVPKAPIIGYGQIIDENQHEMRKRKSDSEEFSPTKKRKY